MIKKNITKDVFVTARLRDPASGEIVASRVRATGQIEVRDGVTTFIENKPGGIRVSFSWEVLRNRGNPGRSAEDKMTFLLKHYIFKARKNIEHHTIAEQMRPGGSVSKYHRIANDIWPVLRLIKLVRDQDNRFVALAFLKCPEYQEYELAGPAWVLAEGQRRATFHQNVGTTK